MQIIQHALHLLNWKYIIVKPKMDLKSSSHAIGGNNSMDELERKNMFLEVENKQLYAELEQVKIQLGQYKTVCESQKSALKDKDDLLEQFRQVNESLKNDLKSLRELKNTVAGHSTVNSSFSDNGPSRSMVATYNPWAADHLAGNEPEHFRKIFIGGLIYETDVDTLRKHFEKFGEVERAEIMRDPQKQSRGFGFVVYATAAMVDEAQKNRPHRVDGKEVNSKRALPREDTDRRENNSASTKKLYISGMNRDTDESQITDYFCKYGDVESVEMITFKDTGKKRGFAFVHFRDYDTVDKLVLIKYHVINGANCEVKKAQPREEMDRRGPSGRERYDQNDNYGRDGTTSRSDSRSPRDFHSSRNYPSNRDYPSRPDSYSGGQYSYSSPPDSYHYPPTALPPQAAPPPPMPEPSPQNVSVEHAQAWAAYYNSMAAAAAAQATVGGGPLRTGSDHSNRSQGPYGSYQTNSGSFHS